MATLTNRETIQYYFADKTLSKWVYLGLLFGLVGLGGDGIGPKAVGLLVLAGCAAYIYDRLGQRQPTDAEVDAAIAAEVALLVEACLVRADVTREQLAIPPAVIQAPHIAPGLLSKQGEDGVRRCTPLSVTVVLMADAQMIFQSAVLNLLSGVPANQVTDEYFYRDVVSVSTATISQVVELDQGKRRVRVNEAETFEVKTSGGSGHRVVFGDLRLAEVLGGGRLPPSNAQEAVQALRQVLRVKKAGAA